MRFVLCSEETVGKGAGGGVFVSPVEVLFLQNSSTFDVPSLQPELSRKLCDPLEASALRPVLSNLGPQSLCRLYHTQVAPNALGCGAAKLLAVSFAAAEGASLAML